MTSTADATAEVHALAVRARRASHRLALATRATKDAALAAMTEALLEQTDVILIANQADVARAESAGTPANVVDRLRLSTERLAAMSDGLRQVAGLPDLVGEWSAAAPWRTAWSCASCGCRSASSQ